MSCKNQKAIAFTFDDAPHYEALGDNPSGTIVDTLRYFGGKATFFLIGSSLKKYGRRLVDELIANDFEIANHTDTHVNLRGLSEDAIRSEILTLQDTVKRDFGVEMKYFRPPGLKADETVFRVTEELKMPVIHGSEGAAYVADWNPETSPEYVKRHCLDNVYPGQIILMHSYSQSTQQVFYDICARLSEQGYRFVTLSELFECYGVTNLPCNRALFDAQLSL